MSKKTFTMNRKAALNTADIDMYKLSGCELICQKYRHAEPEYEVCWFNVGMYFYIIHFLWTWNVRSVPAYR